MPIKILHLDIETAPHVLYSWGLHQQYLTPDKMIESGYTLCWAAKWHGNREVIFRGRRDGTKKMLGDIYDLINEADAVCHYNGTKFDIPILNQEFAKAGMMPPAPHKDIDLYRTVRNRFKLASNKLDYVCQHFGLGAKVKHKGMELWAECMAGCPKAWRKMEMYNRRDVRLNEGLYRFLLPWIPNHPNQALYIDPTSPVCTNCGSTHLHRRGEQPTNTMVYWRYQCQDCGTWLRARKNCGTVEQKENTLVYAR